MDKKALLWRISELIDNIDKIHFPEYQREPTIWSRAAKQRLIDSIVRGFDIASIYLYRHEDEDRWDCIDGRQRIGAIRAFAHEGPLFGGHGGPDYRDDETFTYKILNEIYDEKKYPFRVLDGQGYGDIKARAGGGDKIASSFIQAFDKYPLTIVQLSNADKPEEFNLQFTRLNLGVLINSGEKLHAMVGDLRDACFDVLGTHSFLKQVDIPTRRFAREQLAAQIVAQVFAVEESRRDNGVREFTRNGYLDLQRLFKVHSNLGEIDSDRRKWITKILEVMDLLSTQVQAIPRLRSRAIVLSLFMLAYERKISNEDEAQQIAEFARLFLDQLKLQIDGGNGNEHKYVYLMDFQHNLAQGSSHKSSVRDRALALEESYDFWTENRRLMHQKEYEKAVASMVK